MKKILICLLFLLPYLAHSQDFMMQAWYWDYPKTTSGANWVGTLNGQAAGLSGKFTYMWLPPLAKASFGNSSNGYDPRDLYDYGDYTGGCGWGNRSGLNSLVATYNSYNIKSVGDLVFNHRDGGRAENNPAVENWIKNYNGSQGAPFPSDRVRAILPLGGSTSNGAGDYYIKIRSNTQNVGNFGNKPYRLYLSTNKKGWQSQADGNESEPNGGGDCGQAFNVVTLGRNFNATTDGGGCLTDEFKLTLAAGDYNATDTLYIYFSSQNGQYSDHRPYGIWSASRNMDVVNELKYQTYTDFTNMPSGQGAMNYQQFKPNGANSTNLSGDEDGMWFFYDYEQANAGCSNTLIDWAKWNWSNVGLRGMRMDAVKHFPPSFVSQMLNNMNSNGMNPGMVVGESFEYNASTLKGWVDNVTNGMSSAAQSAIKVRVFDFALRNALKSACDGFGYDVRNVYTSGIVEGAGASGFNSVTFVNNHDFRGAGEPVQNDPKLAYAYILTNNRVGTPCVFYPDYYGVSIPNAPTVNLQAQIDQLIAIHKQHIFGANQLEYLNKEGSSYLNGSNYISAGAGASKNTTQIYQIKGGVSGRDVVVAINYSGQTLKVDHLINTSGNPQGTKFDDVVGNSAFPFAQVDANGRIYLEIPPRSYSVWVRQSGQPASPITVAATNVSNVTCNGGNNGSATVSATGGSGCTISYLWSNGVNAATASNLTAGVYSCIATCGTQTGSYTVTITQPTAINVGISNTQNVTCVNPSSATVLATGGVGNFAYAWSNTLTGATVAISNAGTYSVTATDANNCKKTAFVTVGANQTPPTTQIIASGQITCANSSVTLSNSLQNATNQYKWSDNSTNPNYVVSTTGTYGLTLTNTSNGCTQSNTYNVTSNKTAPTANISTTNPTICPNSSTVLDASTSTGGGTLSYAWTGVGIVSGANTSKATVNKAGNYTVVVTDNSNGCTASKSATVSVLAAATLTATLTNSTCAANNGKINLSVNTGTIVSYVWTNPPLTSNGTGAVINNLAAGAYNITTTLSNGCTSLATVTITATPSVAPFQIQGNSQVCAGGTTTLSTANTYASYLWSNGKTTPTFTVNNAGDYSVTVTDANGCKGSSTKTITVAPQPTVSIATDTFYCNKTSLQLNVTTSSSLASTVWSGVGNFSSNVLSPIFSSAGNYTLTATTNLGCSQTFTTTIYQDKKAPTVSIVGNKAICPNESTTLTANSSANTFKWNTNATSNAITTNQTGTYIVTVTNSAGCKSIASVNVFPAPNLNIVAADVKGCENQAVTLASTTTATGNLTYNWTNNAGTVGNSQNVTLPNITPSNAGNYYVTVKNALGCIGIDTLALSVSPKMTVALSGKADCGNSANVTSTVTGGTPNYYYTWNVSSSNKNNITIAAPASIILTVTDAFASKTISNYNLIALQQMNFSSNIQPTTTNTGAINLTVTGAAPFTYNWSNNEKTEDLINLAQGKYCVTVTDANACQRTECFEVTNGKVGTTENTLGKAIRVFPNPVENILTIETNGNLYLTKIELFDDKGSKINAFSSETRQIDMNTLPSAVYFIKFYTKDGFTVKEIIKIQ